MKKTASRIRRFAIANPPTDTALGFSLQVAAGFTAFRIISIFASFTNNIAAAQKTWINFGVPVDLGYWSNEGPNLADSASGVGVMWYIGGQVAAGVNYGTGAYANAGIPDIEWSQDLRIQINTDAASYNISSLSVIIEDVP